MSVLNPHIIAAHSLRELLGEGSILDQDAVRTIDALLAPASGAVMAKALAQDEDAETQSILELICFPDKSLQARLEPLLADAAFGPLDEPIILDHLTDPPPLARFTFPDGRGTAEIHLPAWAVASFLARLHIDRNPDVRLVEAVAAGTPPELQATFRAKLRNCRFHWSEPRIDFLCLFFQNIDFVAQNPEHLLDFILALFHEMPDAQDLWSAISAKKQEYAATLEKAAAFEEQRRNKNMETLTMQGIRIPYLDAADIRDRLECLDAVCLAVFGLTPPVKQTAAVDLGPIDGDEDLKRVIRMLS